MIALLSILTIARIQLLIMMCDLISFLKIVENALTKNRTNINSKLPLDAHATKKLSS